jgi:hypothetical protein
MKDELLAALSKAAVTQLALESLRSKDTAQALELLELDLDATVLTLGRLAKEVTPTDRDRVTATLQQIRAYRRTHPRRVEADLGSMATGLLVRAGHNHPASGKAGIASPLTIGHHCPGLPDPERSVIDDA